MPLPSTSRLRIFISSPGDVAEERVIANNLVRRLADEFANRLWIEPVFWEHEPLLATETFQKQIPPPRNCEVAICILWSRIGTRLPADITRQEDSRFGLAGSRYVSGTEYEFEDAAKGFEKSGAPHLLVYRKTATPLVDLNDKAALLRRLEQKEALDEFVQKWFFNEQDGTLKAAFHSFATTAEFERVLEEHLRKLIVRRLESLPPSSEDTAAIKISWTAGSPFRGLNVFEFEHALVFFGRTQAIGDVLNALRKNAAAGRAFVLVLGVSGGGKSSLVRAGVLPVLTQPGVIEGVGLWRRAVLKPSDGGGNIMQALALALLASEALPELGSDGTTPSQLAELLSQSPAGAFSLIKGGLSQASARLAVEQKLSQQPEARLALVVDQLEELFTAAGLTPADRQAFIAVLASLARSGRVFVLATLRGDFYHRVFELPELGALKEGPGQYDLPLPSAAEIGQMIRQPARAAGLSFEEEPQAKVPLDEVLREAATRSPESLPLLEFALEELYQRRTPQGLLTYAAYQELGGVEGALAKRAEAVFESLLPEVQATLPRVMRGLVSVGDGDAIARQQALVQAVAPTAEGKVFVEAFVQARLFTADRTSSGEAVVRVTHEALLRNWPRVKTWLESDKELLIVRGRVSVAAARWQTEGRRSDMLLGEGKPLLEAENLAARLRVELTPEERSFIAASRSRRQRRTLVKRTAIVALLLLTVAASVAAVYARHQRALANGNAQRAARGEANAREHEANAQLRLAEGLVSQGNALAMAGRWLDAKGIYREAYGKFVELQVSPFKATAAMSMADAASPPELLTLVGHAGHVNGVAVSPDGRTALSGGDDKTLKLWDLTTGTLVRTLSGHGGTVYTVAISPDGRTAVSGGEDKTLKLWDLAAGKEIRTLPGHTESIFSVAFSPDGGTALSGSVDGTLKLWDLSTGKDVRTFVGHTGYVNSVAISPDGHTAVSACLDGTLKLWDLATAKESRTLTGHQGVVTSVAFGPDGRTVLSGSWDTTLRLWDVETGKEILTLPGRNGPIDSVSFSRDGHFALAGSQYGAIELWDLNAGTQVRTLAGHTALVNSVAFSPDGRSALSGSWDSTLKLWDLGESKEIRTFAGHSDKVNGVAFSPDGRAALTGSNDHTLKLWDSSTGKELRDFTGHAGPVTSVVFSRDGRSAVSGSEDQTVRRWDLTSGKEIRNWAGHTGSVTSVAVSPDGRSALSGSEDKTLRLWDLSSDNAIRTLAGHAHEISSIAFSPDGGRAVSGSWDQTVTLWDVNTGQEIRTLTGHTHEVMSVAVSPDSRTALSGAADNVLKLWDLQTGKGIRTFSGHANFVQGVAFSPDGRTAVSGSVDATIKLWDLETGKEIQTLAGHIDQVTSVAFGPDGGCVLSGSWDKSAKLWDFSRAAVCLDFEPRVRQAQSMLAAKPDDAVALRMLGEWYALRGRNDWAVEFLEKARVRGATISPLTLGHCYWELSDTLPPKSSLTPEACLAAADREFNAAVAASQDEQEKFHLRLCLSAIHRTIARPASPSTGAPASQQAQ